MLALLLMTTAMTISTGDPLPTMKGEFLTGKEAVLPAAAKGKVALLALGFSYDSRFAVEEWVKRFRGAYESNPGITFYEVPVIGGMAVMGKWFIDAGMRSGTPKADHEHVITVWKGAGQWKDALGVKDLKQASLILLDREGRVAWRHNGLFSEDVWRQLSSKTEALLESAR